MELLILFFGLISVIIGAGTVGMIAIPLLILCFFAVPALFMLLPKIIAWFAALIGLLWLFEIHPLLFFIVWSYVLYIGIKQKRNSTRQLL